MDSMDKEAFLASVVEMGTAEILELFKTLSQNHATLEEQYGEDKKMLEARVKVLEEKVAEYEEMPIMDRYMQINREKVALEEQLRTAKERVAELESNDELAKTIREQTEAAKLARKNDIDKLRIDVEQKIEECNKKEADMDAERKELNDRIELLKSEFNIEREKWVKEKCERNRIRGQQEDQIQELIQKQEEWTDEKKKMEEKLRVSETNSLMTTNQLRKTSSNQEAEIRKLNTLLKEKDQATSQLQKTLQHRDGEIADLKHQLIEKDKSSQSVVAAFERDMEVQRTEIQDLKDWTVLQQKEIETHKTLIASQAAQLLQASRVTDELAETKKQLEESEKVLIFQVKEAENFMDREKEERAAEKENFEKKIREITNKYDDLKRNFDVLEKKQSLHDSERAEDKKLFDANIQMVLQEHFLLKKKYEELESQKNSLETAVQKGSEESQHQKMLQDKDNEEKQAELNNRIKQLTVQLEEANQRHQTLMNRTTEKAEEQNNLELQLRDALQDQKELKIKIEQLEKSKSLCNEENGSLKLDVETLRNEARKNAETLEEFKSEHNQYAQQLEQMTERWKTQLTIANEAVIASNRDAAELKKIQDQMNELVETLRATTEDRDEIRKQLEEMKSRKLLQEEERDEEKRNLEETLQKTMIERDAFHKELDALKNVVTQNNTLEAQNAQLKAELQRKTLDIEKQLEAKDNFLNSMITDATKEITRLRSMLNEKEETIRGLEDRKKEVIDEGMKACETWMQSLKRKRDE